jgi:hypothetical protein
VSGGVPIDRAERGSAPAPIGRGHNSLAIPGLTNGLPRVIEGLSGAWLQSDAFSGCSTGTGGALVAGARSRVIGRISQPTYHPKNRSVF